MNVHISYKIHKTPDIEREINHLIEKLERRLQVFRPDLVHLKGILEHNSDREGTTVALNLRLPSGQMAAQESASNATSAIKATLDAMLQQVKKHKDLLRSSHKWSRRQGTRDRLPSVPFEKTLAAVSLPTVSADDVRSYVNVNLRRLERFIEREIFFRENSEQLVPESLTKEEVIDEVIARALEDGERPDRIALEPWLYRLALRSVDDLARGDGDGSPNIPLELSARKQNVRGSDEAELQYHQPDETLIEENVIADRRVSTPEEIASSDELAFLVQTALRGSKQEDREALILHAMEGFSVEEIATITDRQPGAVLDSIAAARQHLRMTPTLSQRLPSQRVQSTGTD
jgi:RNA polymerase sigma factor (sigma-70 family)